MKFLMISSFLPSVLNFRGKLLEAIQMISQLKKRGGRKNLQKASSRGSKLKAIEDQISCLDKYQSKAVIETVEGTIPYKPCSE